MRVKTMKGLPTSRLRHKISGTGHQNLLEGQHLGNFAEKHTWGGSSYPLGLLSPAARLLLRPKDMRNP